MAGRDAGRRRHVLAATVGLLSLSILIPLSAPATPAAATPRKGTTIVKAPTLAQSGPVTFWDCPAKTTSMLVVVNTLTLHPGQTLDISFTVRNGGTASCNYTAPSAGVSPGPTSPTLTAGPCGSLNFSIQDSHHHVVWPGDEVINCPALGVAQLAPGATVSGAGSWVQTRPNSTRRVKPGTYTLVVQNKRFAFPIRVAKS